MIRITTVSNILVDEGISLDIQGQFTEQELYEFAEDICEKRDEVLEDLITDALMEFMRS